MRNNTKRNINKAITILVAVPMFFGFLNIIAEAFESLNNRGIMTTSSSLPSGSTNMYIEGTILRCADKLVEKIKSTINSDNDNNKQNNRKIVLAQKTTSTNEDEEKNEITNTASSALSNDNKNQYLEKKAELEKRNEKDNIGIKDTETKTEGNTGSQLPPKDRKQNNNENKTDSVDKKDVKVEKGIKDKQIPKKNPIVVTQETKKEIELQKSTKKVYQVDNNKNAIKDNKIINDNNLNGKNSNNKTNRNINNALTLSEDEKKNVE